MNPILSSALRLTASLWLAGATVVLADPAAAARSLDLRPRAVVQVSDLDLQVPAGRATAERRLRVAALAVCKSGDARVDQSCIDTAMTQGQQAIDAHTGQIATR